MITILLIAIILILIYAISWAIKITFEKRMLICSTCNKVNILEKIVKKNSNVLIGLNQYYKTSYEQFLRKYNKELSEYARIKTCEVCGCLIATEHATKGKPEIKTRGESELAGESGKASTKHCEDYIYTPYYCKTRG